MSGSLRVTFEPSDCESLTMMAALWAQKVKAHEPLVQAGSLYVGRSVQEAFKVARALKAELMFASTGMGLIPSDGLCPLYDLTVAEGAGSIRLKLNEFGASPRDWWDAINTQYNQPYPIKELAGSPDVGLILIALSANYIDLIANDLAQINAVDAAKIRIFTSRPGIIHLPEHFKHVAMPYDERLESSRIAGTRNDYPQRAMLHFIEDLNLAFQPITVARHTVNEAMDRLQTVSKVARRRVTDQEVLTLLKEVWASYGGSSTRLLRYLRDEAKVACEQSRFRTLWSQLKDGAASRGEA
ncbi:hypothetical protein [Pseudomonas duriflava]|nr:hypothetical protein [Pseudomonas duriflava]